MSVSIHDKTLKGGEIHHYNDMREIAKTRFLHHLLLLQRTDVTLDRLKYLSPFLRKSAYFWPAKCL